MPERFGAGATANIDAGRLAELIARERAAYGEGHPSSRQAFAAAGANLLGGVPMTWMRMWPGRIPDLPGGRARRPADRRRRE